MLMYIVSWILDSFTGHFPNKQKGMMYVMSRQERRLLGRDDPLKQGRYTTLKGLGPYLVDGIEQRNRVLVGQTALVCLFWKENDVTPGDEVMEVLLRYPLGQALDDQRSHTYCASVLC